MMRDVRDRPWGDVAAKDQLDGAGEDGQRGESRQNGKERTVGTAAAATLHR
jgi:hypothetical protein